MTKRRRYAAAAAIGKRLYVVGGYDGRQRMNSVECLDLSQENATWQPVASLTYRRGRKDILKNIHYHFFFQHFLVFVFIKVNSCFLSLSRARRLSSFENFILHRFNICMWWI